MSRSYKNTYKAGGLNYRATSNKYPFPFQELMEDADFAPKANLFKMAIKWKREWRIDTYNHKYWVYITRIIKSHIGKHISVLSDALKKRKLNVKNFIGDCIFDGQFRPEAALKLRELPIGFYIGFKFYIDSNGIIQLTEIGKEFLK